MAASAVNSTPAGGRPAVPMPPPAGAPVADQVAAATEAIRSNPGMLKDMAKMMESMPPEQLEAMMGSVPGAPPGFKASAAHSGRGRIAALAGGCAAGLPACRASSHPSTPRPRYCRRWTRRR